MVFCCSTLHELGNTIKRMRKCPRKTQNNRNHVDRILGENRAVEIYIPTLIDDYNYWMGGVDVSDQRISYYHPSNLVLQRNWIPIFMQLLSIIRNNAYLVHRQNMGSDALSHKQFILEMISWLMSRANHFFVMEQRTNRNENTPSSSSSSSISKRRKSAAQLSSSSPDLLTSRFSNRYVKPKELHVPKSGKRGTCVVCSENYLQKKKAGEDVSFEKEVRRTVIQCSFCSLDSKQPCFLCKAHFSAFHE